MALIFKKTCNDRTYRQYFRIGWLSLPQRPKSVRNRCKIEVFCGVIVLSSCALYLSVGVGAFVMRLSHISSFLLLHVD